MAFLDTSRPLRRKFPQHSTTGVSLFGQSTPIQNGMSSTMNTHSISNNKNGPITLNKFIPLPPISNIPGLNPDSAVIAAAEKKVFRTFKVQETDSTYIKLAKQGGHKNLLEYTEFGKENANVNNEATLSNNKKAKKVEWLDSKEEKAWKSPVNSPTTENVNNNNNNIDINNNTTISNNHSNSKKGPAASTGKSIIEMKKQAKVLKERPDLLPVDNTEILKHLNAPRRPVLPKTLPRSRLASKFIKVAGR